MLEDQINVEDLVKPIEEIKETRQGSRLNRYGYILKKDTLTDGELDKIRTELVMKPFKRNSFGCKVDKPFPIYSENDEEIALPKYYGFEHFGKPETNRLLAKRYPKFDMEYTKSLRPIQETITDNIIDGFNKYKGGLLIAGCGSGKTNMAIYIACLLKLKTLFVVHKKFLKNQAVDRILTFTNCKSVGLIQRNKVDVDHPFVIGMIHSLVQREYDPKIFKDFGLVIIDEVHHMGARSFSKFFLKLSAPYMLGISAETARDDGLYKILNMFMGPILHDEPQPPNDKVIVKSINFKTKNKKSFAKR